MSNPDVDNLGPLRGLVGIWEGDKGHDLAPSDEAETDRQPVESLFRERISFEPTGRVDNHEQSLYGLRYSTQAWRKSTGASFHEENGYWLWDAQSGLVMRCFNVPRGISLIAGGEATADAKGFKLEAERGSTTFGICVSPFLEREFRIVRYTLEVEIHDDGFSYSEDTVMEMPGADEPFHHTDRNRLRKS